VDFFKREKRFWGGKICDRFDRFKSPISGTVTDTIFHGPIGEQIQSLSNDPSFAVKSTDSEIRERWQTRRPGAASRVQNSRDFLRGV
jgi:hypothetical protein